MKDSRSVEKVRFIPDISLSFQQELRTHKLCGVFQMRNRQLWQERRLNLVQRGSGRIRSATLAEPIKHGIRWLTAGECSIDLGVDALHKRRNFRGDSGRNTGKPGLWSLSETAGVELGWHASRRHDRGRRLWRIARFFFALAAAGALEFVFDEGFQFFNAVEF